jgi:Flp pilus assembly protein TadG
MKPIKPRKILACSRQSGASAIEFALVFPLMLAIVYGGVVYSYVYVLQQSINFAAQQGVQAAISVVPTANAATDLTARTTLAHSVVMSSLSWLPGGQAGLVSTAAAVVCPGAPAPAGTGTTFSYTVNFALGGGTAGSLFPSLVNLPMGLGSIPPLPTTLSACAVAFT